MSATSSPKRKNQKTDETLNTEIDPENLLANKIRKLISLEYEQRNNIPDSWLNVSGFKSYPVIIVTMKDKNQPADTINMKNEVDSLLNDSLDENAKAVDVQCGFNCVKIKCASLKERKKLLLFLNTHKPEWNLAEPPLHNPQVIICNLQFDTNQAAIDRWLIALLVKNQLPRHSNITVINTIRISKKLHHVVLEVSPDLRQLIEAKGGELYVGSKRLKIFDFFGIRLCIRCNYFGHFSNDCDKVQRCRYCDMLHLAIDCPHKEIPNKHFCPNCQMNGHSAYDKNCNTYIRMVRAGIEKRNYEYRWVMR